MKENYLHNVQLEVCSRSQTAIFIDLAQHWGPVVTFVQQIVEKSHGRPYPQTLSLHLKAPPGVADLYTAQIGTADLENLRNKENG